MRPFLAKEGLSEEEEKEEGREEKKEKIRAGRSKVGKVSRFMDGRDETPTVRHTPKVRDPLTREEKNLDSGLFVFWWGSSTPLHTCFLPPAEGTDAPGPPGIGP